MDVFPLQESGDVFSAVSLTLLIGITLAYSGAAYAQWRNHDGWSAGRVCAFGASILLLGVAVWPSMVEWAHHDLRGHMVQHLLIGMFAPLGFVLSAPMTLCLRSLSVPAARRVTAVLRTRAVRVLSHPATALVLNVGGMYLLYATPLYAASRHSPILHGLLHVHFLAAGILFCWSILAGPDPAPHPTSLRCRLGTLFLAVAAHAILGKLMYGYVWPPGTPHGVEEIRSAAQIMYYGGDAAEGLLAVTLFWRWYRSPASHRSEFFTGMLQGSNP